MLRIVSLLLLTALQCASAAWLRVGLLDESPSKELRPTVRLTTPDQAWTWEGQLTSAEGASTGLLISGPIRVPDGVASRVEAQLIEGEAVRTLEIQLLPSESSQWFLDDPGSDKRFSEERTIAAQDDTPRVSPNPFNLTTRISLNLAERANADLRIVDILGRTAQHVHSGPLETGSHSWMLDARSLASGSYFLTYRLSPGSSGATRLLLLK